MSKSSYVKKDYNYLFLYSDKSILMVKCNGQLDLPCIESDKIDEEYAKVIIRFRIRFSHNGIWRYTQTRVLKYRRCGIKKLLYLVKAESEVSGITMAPYGEECVWVSIEQAVVNKPNLLSETAKAAINDVGKYRGWSKAYKKSRVRYTV